MPKLDCPGSNKRFGVSDTRRRRRPLAENLFCLSDIALTVDFIQSGRKFYEHRDYDKGITNYRQRTAIAEDLVVQLEQPGTCQMGCIGLFVVGEGRQHLVDNEIIPIPPLPQ